MQHKEATSNILSEAVNSKTKFIEVNEHKYNALDELKIYNFSGPIEPFYLISYVLKHK